jgi:hypothetical protein
MAISDRELKALVTAITTTIKAEVSNDLAPLTERIATLEARPPVGVEYGGTHELDKAYAAGVLVTRKGGLWLCLRGTTQTPGMDPQSWKLIVKSGQVEPDR